MTKTPKPESVSVEKKVLAVPHPTEGSVLYTPDSPGMWGVQRTC